MTDTQTAYLAFDLGASSGRAVLGSVVDGHLRVEEVHRFPTPLIEEGDHLYWDIEEIWQHVQEGLRLARKQAPGLRSVSVDSWAVDYVPLDAEGKVLRNPYSYRDPRVWAQFENAFETISKEELYDRTGVQLLHINTLYQVLADLEEEPDLVARTAQRLLIADYLLYRLSGRAVAELTMAGTTQLTNVRRRTWDDELMERFGIPANSWPEIVPPGTRLGPLQAGEAVDGQSTPSVVATCSHDTAAAVAAVPADAEGSPWAYISCGTWSLMGIELQEPVLSAKAQKANFTNELGLDNTIRLLKNLTGLWVLQECERVWRAEEEDLSSQKLVRKARAAKSMGETIDLDDESFASRGNMPEKVRTYCRNHGVQVPQSRGEMVRLILESLAEAYRRTLKQLEEVTGEAIEIIHIVGGGSHNELLCRWTADVCSCRVISGPAEATSIGNLLVQAREMGDLPEGTTIRDVVRNSCGLKIYEPSTAEHKARGVGVAR